MTRSRRTQRSHYTLLLNNISRSIESARQRALHAINTELIRTNWEIGKHIIEFEQQGRVRAEYGSDLLSRLSRDLKLRFGKGFSRRNVLDMRRFYLVYPIWQAVPAKLSWTHLIVLMSIDEDARRAFYEGHAVHEHWTTRELQRYIASSLFERRTLSQHRKTAIAPRRKHTVVSRPDDIVKDPYILDFLNISRGHRTTERHLEQRIIDNLQMFLLELGKGFSFVGRQVKISLRNKHFHIDLVFYNRYLRCFVLIDLKTRPVSHSDIGQMNLYLNYFRSEENGPDDREPIGIILSADKDEVLVEYAMGGISNRIFVSRYRLYLPEKELLQNKVQALLHPSKGPPAKR
ncbi:MAG: DUF1016 domain-containing protein [Bacteroidetes bacterium]|nr:DUF1016 domain-containing protein [Bacteroidota bacterium]